MKDDLGLLPQEPGIAIEVPFMRECHYCGRKMRPTSNSVWEMLVFETPWEGIEPGEKLMHWPDMHVACRDDEGNDLDTRAAGDPKPVYGYDPWPEIDDQIDYVGNPYGMYGGHGGYV